MRRFLSFAFTWWKGKSAWRALGISVLLAVPVTALIIFHGLIVAFLSPLVSWMAGLAFVVPPALYFGRYWILPAWRGASLVNKKYEEARKKSAAAVSVARKKLQESEQAKREAQDTIERGEPIIDRYGAKSDGSSPPPSLMLEYLLKDSADVTELRGRLGTLGTVRRCFSQLNYVIQQMNENGATASVQRIVIYIDDLDRCSEEQVVQVLEAIHLMLAFPCFVVVAAVDVRWLRAALKSQHQAMAGEDSKIDPADYLEKIFQIPFWVRTLSREAREAAPYVDFVRALLRVDEDEVDAVESDSDEATDIEFEANRHGAFPRLEPLRPVATASDLAAGRQLKLTFQEARLIEAMQPIASRSPRAVKRMINIYRLIRVAVPDHLLDDYLTSGREIAPYWAVILALAWETGLRASDMAALAHGIGEIEQDDLENLFGYAQGVFDAEILEHTSSATKEVMHLIRSPASDALTIGLNIIAAHRLELDHAALARAIKLVSRYSFRLE